MSHGSCPRRILLVRLSHLGDVVHTLPVFHALRRAFPAARLAWALQPEYAELVRPLPGLARVVCFERRGGPGAWLGLRKQLREFQPDWTIDAQGNWKSAAVAALSGAARRSGFHWRDMRERSAAWLLNDRVPPWLAGSSRHAVDRSLHLAAHLVDSSCESVRRELPEDWLLLSAVERSSGRKRWRALLGQQPEAPVLLQLAAPGDVRSWPLQHQLQLLRELDSRGRDVLVLSGPAEAPLGAQVAAELAGLPHLHHWVGQRSLRELGATLRAASEAGATMISCDSGPLHMAAACGLPCLVLAGPQDELRTGPWPTLGPGSPHRLAQAREGLDCAPCLSRRCHNPQGPQCMERIEALRVLECLDR